MLHNLDFLRVGEPWRPLSEAPRMEQYRLNRLLWEGRHTEVYGDWWRVLREEYGVSHEILFNFHERSAKLFADLTFGEAPVLTAGEYGSPEQESVNLITERSGFANVGWEAAIDLERYGNALLKLVLKNGEAVLQAQSPAIWYPVVSRDDQRDVQYHVLAWTFEVDEERYLRAEIHDRGRIENRLFALKGDTIQEPVDLKRFFPNRKESEETGLEDFMVFHIPGPRASDEFFGQDAYQKLDSLVLERMSRAGQLSRIQDKHSDPNMYGSERMMTTDPVSGKKVLEAGGKFFPVPDDGVDRGIVPGYITWDAAQEAQFKLMDKLKEDLYEISETTPTAFGSSATGYAESGTSLRLRMVPPLLKASRLTRRFDPVVKKALILAARLESIYSTEDVAVPETINITWRDGLPDDPREMADIEAVRLQSGSTSRYSAIKRLNGGTDEEIQEELDRMNEEAAPEETEQSSIARLLSGEIEANAR